MEVQHTKLQHRKRGPAVIGLAVTASLIGGSAGAQEIRSESLRGNGNTGLTVAVKSTYQLACDIVKVTATDATGSPINIFNKRPTWYADMRYTTENAYDKRTIGYETKINSSADTIPGDKLVISCLKNTSETILKVIETLGRAGDATIGVWPTIDDTRMDIAWKPRPEEASRVEFQCLYNTVDRSGTFRCDYQLGSEKFSLNGNQTLTRTYFGEDRLVPLTVTATPWKEVPGYTFTGTDKKSMLLMRPGTRHVVTANGAFSMNTDPAKYTMYCDSQNLAAAGSDPEALNAVPPFKCVYSVGEDKYTLEPGTSKTIEIPKALNSSVSIDAALNAQSFPGYTVNTTHNGILETSQGDAIPFTFKPGNVYEHRMKGQYTKDTPIKVELNCVNNTPDAGTGECAYFVSPVTGQTFGDFIGSFNKTPAVILEQNTSRTILLPSGSTNKIGHMNRLTKENPEYTLTNPSGEKVVTASGKYHANFTFERNKESVVLNCMNDMPNFGSVKCDYRVEFGSTVRTGTLEQNQVATFAVKEGSSVNITNTVTATPNAGNKAVNITNVNGTFTAPWQANASASFQAANVITGTATATTMPNSYEACSEIAAFDKNGTYYLFYYQDAFQNYNENPSFADGEMTFICQKNGNPVHRATIGGNGDFTVKFNLSGASVTRGDRTYTIYNANSGAGGMSDPVPGPIFDPIFTEYNGPTGPKPAPTPPGDTDPLEPYDPIQTY